MLASTIISAVAMVTIAGLTGYYAITTKKLWKSNIRLWELSRDSALCNYAVNYLNSFIQTFKEDKLREVYMNTATKTIYDALEKLLSSETAKEVEKFRRIVDVRCTENILKIKTKLKN